MNRPAIALPRTGDEPSPRSLRVCHVAATTEGATWMVEQLRELRRRHGHQVFAVVSGERGGLVDKLEAEGIPHFAADFRFASLRDLCSLPGKIFALARLFREQRFDVVQTHLFHSMVIGRFAAWLADVPVRLAMVAGPFHLEADTPRWIDGSTCWMETALIASCEHTRELYRGLGVAEDRIELAYYGPDAAGFSPARTAPAHLREDYCWPPDTPLIVMAAYFYQRFVASRWTPRFLWGRATKGHEYLIRAMPLVLRQFPQARCVLVGSGWEEGGTRHMEEMMELVHALGLEHAIVFTGFRADIAAILRTASVSVQPSLTENLGGTIESLLMECPTVASRVGGMTDSIREGETGALVAPADPEDLARGIISLLSAPERAQELARRGRALMLERFTLDRTVHDLDALYRRRIMRRDRPRRGYRLLVALARLFLAMPVIGFLVLRLTAVDYNLLASWEGSPRPWEFSFTHAFARGLYRRMYSLVQRMYCWLWRVGGSGRRTLRRHLAGKPWFDALDHALDRIVHRP